MDTWAFLKRWVALCLQMPAVHASVNGQGIRMIRTRKNSIITSFNRNFAKRNDGNPNTHAFVASPEIVTAMAIAGDLCFNPLTDSLTDSKGKQFQVERTNGSLKCLERFCSGRCRISRTCKRRQQGYSVKVSPDSDRLQLLEPFRPWEGTDLIGLEITHQGKRKMYNRSYFNGRTMVEIPRTSRQYFQQYVDRCT